MTSSSVKTKRASVLKEKIRATRPLDYIYDPVYTFSGPKDFYKTAYESFRSSSQFSVQPIFDSMFSDMLRYPRASLLLKSSHELPPYIDNTYEGKLRAAEEQSSPKADVTGGDRFKFFKRPTTETCSFEPPVTSRFPMLGIETFTKLGTLAPPTTAYVKISSSPSKQECVKQTKAIQTDYREAETQTRPWTPPYVTKDSDIPEILTLDTLHWGEELPAGTHTVEIIEHARAKRAWENSLPPLDSVKNVNKRYQMISALEKSTWKFRDEEIQYIHNMRLKKAEETLSYYKKMKAEILEEKIKWITEDRYKEKDRKIKLIEHSKTRALRKLAMKERGYNPKYHKMNIIDELDDHASQVYAPFQHWGTNFRNKHEVLTNTDGIKIDYSDRQNYLLENNKSQQLKFDVNKASQPKRQVELCFRETRWTEENLEKLHSDLKAIRLKDDKLMEKRPFKMIERIPKPSKLRQIPAVPEVTDYDKKMYNAITMLQKVIKGRTIQVELFKERNRWRELIEELRLTTSVDEDPGSSANLNKNKGILKLIVANRRKYLQDASKPREVDPSVLQNIGEGINFLSAELIHFKDEKQVHDLVLDVEYARWRREAAESGRRQKEIKRRREHEEIYNKVTELHEKTANSITNRVCNEARISTADIEAEKLVQEIADDKDATSYEALCRNNDQEKEMIATELLYNFLLPESNKALIRQRMHERNQQCLLAIHDQIFGAMQKEKLEQIPKLAVDFVDGIIDEAVLKLCYSVAEGILESVWQKAMSIVKGNAEVGEIMEELLKSINYEDELQEHFETSSSPLSDAVNTYSSENVVIQELLNAVCTEDEKEELQSYTETTSSPNLGYFENKNVEQIDFAEEDDDEITTI